MTLLSALSFLDFLRFFGLISSEILALTHFLTTSEMDK